MPVHDLQGLAHRLRTRLALPLPGFPAQRTMSPSHRDHLLSDKREYRDAAVLALLQPSDDGPTVLFTVRPDHLNHHGGQISFPGGRREPGEELLRTALRETTEELGLASDEVDVLGELTPLLVPPSGFCVYPFVGITANRPVLTPSPDEVASIIEIPLARLVDPSIRASEPRTLYRHTVQIPHFAVDGIKIWGATAMMLAELVALLDGSDAE